MIRAVLLLKSSGENLFCRQFTEEKLDECLMSGMLSALFIFINEMFGEEMNDIEIGPYKMLFKNFDKEIILVFIFDVNDSIIFIRKKLEEIGEIIKKDFADKLSNPIVILDDFEGLEQIIDEVLADGIKVEIKQNIIEKYREIVDQLKANAEVSESDLLTIDGTPLFSTDRNKEFLRLSLRQMDAFWKSKSEILDQIILYHDKQYLILQKVKNLILSTLIRREIPIGIATMLIEEATDKIMKQSSSLS